MELIPANSVQKIAEMLRDGAVFVYPTETSYGIGCDARNAEAVERIFTIKQRPADKGLVVLMKDTEMLEEYAKIPQKARELGDTHWPGALNIVLESTEDSSIVPACAHAGHQAVRVSSHPFVQELFTEFVGPIVSTSANISGNEPLYDPQEIVEMFEGQEFQPDVIVDGGVIPERPGSTVVRIQDGNIVILRQGEVIV